MTTQISTAALRLDGEWLRTAKHGTTEVRQAGLLMEAAASELDRLREQHHELFEALKLALACEPEDWSIWHDQAQDAVNKVVASMQQATP